ncbi:hypothetical protein LTS10_006577 [Elasticomyces elasticus]|nr:hypothetical protein LTS10_006577 [Elasticomyces elasticus]
MDEESMLQLGDISKHQDGVTTTLRDDEIRLIRVLPCSTDSNGPIKCQMTVVSLNAEPEYLALSYTWGSPPANYIVEIDGTEVLIRKNLWRFLSQSAVTHCSSLPIWVDALSIDQTNAVEVTQQINLMGRIYSQAIKVLAWLGPAHSDSDLAMQTMASSRTRRKPNRFWNTPGGLAVARLCNRAYWTRMWIFQEVMLAQNVVLLCGDKTAEWTEFGNVMASTAWQPQFQRQQDRNVDYQSLMRSPAMAIVQQSVRTVDHGLWHLIMANRAMRCWEPRDKVYGLLGVARLEPGEAIEADYQVPLVRLANTILRLKHRSEGAPQNTTEIVAQCDQLTGAFGIPPGQIYTLVGADGVEQLTDIKKGADCPLGDPGIRGITSWWALFYKHQAVEWLLPFQDIETEVIDTWKWAAQEGQSSVLQMLLEVERVDPHVPYWTEPPSDLRNWINDMAWHDYRKYNDGGNWKYDTFITASYYGHKGVLALLWKAGVRDAVVSYDEPFSPLCAAILGIKKRALHRSSHHRSVVSSLTSTSRESSLSVGSVGTRNRLSSSSASCHSSALSVRSLRISSPTCASRVPPSVRSRSPSRHTSSPSSKTPTFAPSTPSVSRSRARTSSSPAVSEASDPTMADLEVVRFLLEHGVDVDFVRYGINALCLAAHAGHCSLVKLLLDAGADANLPAASGHVTGDVLSIFPQGGPLQAAAECGHFAVVQLLLNRGAEVNLSADHPFGSALHAASGAGHEETVHLLLQSGADPNAQNSYGPALSAAVTRGSYADPDTSVDHVAVVRLLLDAGANPNAKSRNPDHCGSALATVCKVEDNNVETLVTLLEAGADLNAGNSTLNALQVAARYSYDSLAVSTLLQWGADVNAPGSNETREWLQDSLRPLDESGAYLKLQNVLDTKGDFGTALQIASAAGMVRSVRLLICAGAEVNAPGVVTALGIASIADHEEVVQVLEQAGARLTETDAEMIEESLQFWEKHEADERARNRYERRARSTSSEARYFSWLEDRK